MEESLQELERPKEEPEPQQYPEDDGFGKIDDLKLLKEHENESEIKQSMKEQEASLTMTGQDVRVPRGPRRSNLIQLDAQVQS